jgi:hypothetical protein
MKLLVAAAGFAAFATPALAEFYIVQDTTTKRCTIVEQRPTTQTTVVVGDSRYTTRQEAEGAMKTVKICESGGTVGGPVPRLLRGAQVQSHRLLRLLRGASSRKMAQCCRSPGLPGLLFVPSTFLNSSA